MICGCGVHVVCVCDGLVWVCVVRLCCVCERMRSHAEVVLVVCAILCVLVVIAYIRAKVRAVSVAAL